MMRPVSLSEIVAADVTALQPAAAAKGLTLLWQDTDRSLMVNGDSGQLDRLVMNLLSNAVKFTPEGGIVSVGTGCDGGLAVLQVSDTGIGVPEPDRNGLFTRFFRASNVVEESIPGTGLGLAIVRTIVANHHGDLDMTSLEGKGTTVTVKIPLLADQQACQPLADVPVPGEGRPA
jgi:signal transduction histidine kinase